MGRTFALPRGIRYEGHETRRISEDFVVLVPSQSRIFTLDGQSGYGVLIMSLINYGDEKTTPA